MILYFLRHGLAEEREGWEAQDDQRPLTEKGKNQLERQARKLADLGLDVDLIVTSPLARASQTAEIVARRLRLNEKLVEDERLAPGFNLVRLQLVLADHPHSEQILLIGHEPDFSETISDLIGGGQLIFKKGGLARVDIYLRDPLQGELVWLAPPKILLL